MAKKEPMDVIPVRFHKDAVKGLDRYVAKLLKAQPGMTITRSDAIRMLVNRGLEQEGF